jgi:hypothetical protein
MSATSIGTMQRRRLLQLGLGATALLAVAGGGYALLRPGLRGAQLAPAGAAVFHAVARAVLDGSLPADAGQRDAALAAHLLRVEAAIGAFPAATRAELSQLLSRLGSTPGRLGLAALRDDWPQASVADLQQAMQGMRLSSLALRQQAYHALRDLTNAAYYADPGVWPLMGYPGPRPL